MSLSSTISVFSNEEKTPLIFHSSTSSTSKELPLFDKSFNSKNQCNYKETKLLGHYNKSSFLFSVYLIVYVMFLFSGAAIFSVLETPSERLVKARLEGAVDMFLKANPTVSGEALENLIKEVVKATNRGITSIGNNTGEPNWSFGQALFFSSTVVTTIGYGHVTPLSRSGKIFCIIYATVGIPLTLVLLSALVERLLVPTIRLLRWFHVHLGHIYQPLKIRLLHLSTIVLILLGGFVLLPAAIFAHFEPEWDYLDALYYCFISLTTIGLGDYIPGDSPSQHYRPLYKIATTVYLYLGITFMMLTLAVFYDIPQLNLGLLFATDNKVGGNYRHYRTINYESKKQEEQKVNS